MPDTIEQTVTLPAPAERLFSMYLDPVAHAGFTGAPVTIDAKPGSSFSAFNGALCGTMLQTVPGRLIVQAWRANHWSADDLDSTVILTFWPDGAAGRIALVHANVADHDVEGVTNGWEKYYWTPWTRYLQEQRDLGQEDNLTDCNAEGDRRNAQAHPAAEDHRRGG